MRGSAVPGCGNERGNTSLATAGALGLDTPSRTEGPMRRWHATSIFKSHQTMVTAGVCRLGSSAPTTKRDPIWAGGLSTVGGSLPE